MNLYNFTFIVSSQYRLNAVLDVIFVNLWFGFANTICQASVLHPIGWFIVHL